MTPHLTPDVTPYLTSNMTSNLASDLANVSRSRGGQPAGPGRRDLLRVLAAPDRLRTWFQPIVDTATGAAAGWEALTRFTDPDGSPSRWGPQEWFAAEQGSPLGQAMEGLALTRALNAVDRLPPDTFLTMNVSPAAVTSPAVREALATRPDLSRVIIEITETEAVHDVPAVASVCAGVRAAGGLIAVDDAGSGYAGLSLIAHLRPQLVKVDRELIQGCHQDPVKLSLIEVLGVWAAGMDAWLLAEGVETADEYAAVVSLGVPLVQGWFTGRPAREPVGPAAEQLAELRSQRARVLLQDTVASLMQTWPTVTEQDTPARAHPPRQTPSAAPASAPDEKSAPPAPGQSYVVVDSTGWPLGVLLSAPDGVLRRLPISLRVRPSEDVAQVLRRAMGRLAHIRYDPVVVTDPQGRAVGVVPIDALVARVLTHY